MYYLFANPRAAFYTQAVPVPLGALEAKPLGNYIAERFAATGKTVLPAALDALVELCQGHLRRAMANAHALWDATDDEAGPRQWADARAELMGDAAGELQSLWRVFASDERRVLVAVATGGRPPVGRGRHISGSTLPAAHSSLHDKVVIAGSKNRWRIVDPLLEPTSQQRAIGDLIDHLAGHDGRRRARRRSGVERRARSERWEDAERRSAAERRAEGDVYQR